MLAALVPALGPPLCGLVLHLAYTPGHRVCAALLLLALTGMAFGVAGLIDADRAELVVETGIYAQLSASAIFFAHRHRGCSLVLGGLALCGTALGVAEPFVPAIPAAIGPLCFLLLTLVALGIVRSSMEMMLTLLATLISNTLFLVAALVPQAKAVEAIQTVWVTLPICAFMLAFTRHSQATPQSPRISISVSIARRQDQLDLPFRKVTSLCGHPTLGTTRLARFRKWLAPSQRDMSISLSNLHHPDHARFPSTSSSFSSPPQPPNMDVDLEHGKAFHHVLDLKPPPQLPSPPDTPRARVRTATPISHTHRLPSPADSPAVVTDDDQDVRIGMVTPAEKPNFTIRDIFTEAEQYEVACETAQVVDTPVSEPGHGSHEYSDSERDDPTQKSPGASCSIHTPTPLPIPMSTPVPRSPVLSSPSSWVFNNFKRPIKSRSMMSLPLSFGSASGSASPPTLSWKGADKLREKFKRPIAGAYGRALSLSQSPTSQPSSKEDALDSVEEEENGQDNQRATGQRRQQHKRKGSTWSSLSQKSPTFMFMSSVPIMATTSPSSGSEWEWYPSLSKSKSSMSNLNQGQALTSSISNKKKREQTTTPAPASSSDHHQQSETADFVDLTDPFASPTPGFALPKWVGNNGSSVTAASGASGSFGTCGPGVGTNWNGSVSDIGHGGPANPSWGHDSDQEIDVNEKECTTMIRNVPKTIKSRSSAQWGKLPPVPPLPSSSNPDGSKKKQERLEKILTRTTMMTEGVKRTRPSRRRSDSPIKTPSSGTNLMRIMDDVEDGDGDRESEAEKEILERPGSPIPPSPLGSPSLTLTTVMELGINRVTRPTVVIDNNVDVSGSGQLQRKKTKTTIDSDAKNIFNTSSSRKKKNSDIKSRRGRNGSPLPIPFRRKSHRHVANSNVGGTRGVEGKEQGDIDGLNLEEMLLAQRLLKMLNSDEGAV